MTAYIGMQQRRDVIPMRGLVQHVSLIDWISDTLSQGYTNLQSLVKCLVQHVSLH